MAWTYSNPNPVGARQNGSGDAVRWTTPRTVRGTVQMELLDVSCVNGLQWVNPATVKVELVTASGYVVGQTTFSKNWGVPTGYRTLAYLVSPQTVYLRVTATVRAWSSPTGQGNVPTPQWIDWSARLRWGSA